MPVRSLTSSVLKWPDRARVERELRAWADRERERRPELLRLGYFGSYARGDAGADAGPALAALPIPPTPITIVLKRLEYPLVCI